jgi:protease inhibitor Inh
MSAFRPTLRATTLALTTLWLAGCSGVGVAVPGFGSSTPPAEPPPAATANLAGRWLLNSPGRGQCQMTFGSASPDAVEGTIAPQGGCPGKFFTSRKWTLEQGGLVMRDHNGKPLAQLSGDGAQFEGKAAGGEPVTLTR